MTEEAPKMADGIHRFKVGQTVTLSADGGTYLIGRTAIHNIESRAGAKCMSTWFLEAISTAILNFDFD